MLNPNQQIESLLEKIKEKEGSLDKWDVFLVKHWLIEVEKLKRLINETNKKD